MTGAFKRLSLAGKLMTAGGAALGALLIAGSLLITWQSGRAMRGLAERYAAVVTAQTGQEIKNDLDDADAVVRASAGLFGAAATWSLGGRHGKGQPVLVRAVSRCACRRRTDAESSDPAERRT